MSVDIRVPDIGTDGFLEVINILVKIGDTVKQGQSLIELEGDKASVEVPATCNGIVEEILVKEGDKVGTGSLIMKFTSEQVQNRTEDNKEAYVNKADEKNSDVQTVTLTMPDIGQDALSVTEIMIKEGDIVKKDDTILVIEGDKASMDVPSYYSGIVKKVYLKVDQQVKSNDVIALLEIENNDSIASTTSHVENKTTNKVEENQEESFFDKKFSNYNVCDKNNSQLIHASPLVRTIARKNKIDLSKVPASGRFGRVTKEDLYNYINAQNNTPKDKNTIDNKGLNILSWPKVDFSKFGECEKVSLSKIQKISASNLKRNAITIPSVTQFEEIDITETEEFRKKIQMEKKFCEQINANTPPKISILVFVMKALAKLLTCKGPLSSRFRKFNMSFLSDSEEEVILKKFVHIGVAVDTPNGLVVPVIRDVDKKGLLDLASELIQISDKARKGELNLQDMQGSSITISSLGGIGGSFFTPIVNAPDAAILGISKAKVSPVWDCQKEKFLPRTILPISLTYDHRLIDGADACYFTTSLKALLEDWRRITL